MLEKRGLFILMCNIKKNSKTRVEGCQEKLEKTGIFTFFLDNANRTPFRRRPDLTRPALLENKAG